MDKKSMNPKLKRFLNNLAYVVLGGLLSLVAFGTVAILAIEKEERYSDVIVDDNLEEEIDLRYFRQVQGTSVFVGELTKGGTWSSMGSARWFSFGDGSTIRNLIFLNADTLESNKLFPTNDAVIVDIQQYPAESMSAFTDDNVEELVVKWLFYEIAYEDTNADEVINRYDRLTLAISSVDGSDYQEFVSDVDRVYTVEYWQDNELLVIYLQDNKIFGTKISLETFAIQETKEITNPLPEE